MELIWYTSQDGSNWQAMKSPATYKIEWEDLDNESYRSVVTGDLIRDVIKRRWAKISVSWNAILDAEIKPILEAVNTSTLYVKCMSPAFGSGTISFKAYVSKMSCEMLKGTLYRGQPAYSLSFNIIQEKTATWQ